MEGFEEKLRSMSAASKQEQESERPPSNRTLMMDVKCEELENRLVEQIDKISERLLKMQTSVKQVQLMQKTMSQPPKRNKNRRKENIEEFKKL